MIVDDDYIIVGSANINQRSLGGNRDTEMAIGAFQPDHLAENSEGRPRGAVHTFRMALWSAHLGGFHEDLLNPSSQARRKWSKTGFEIRFGGYFSGVSGQGDRGDRPVSGTLLC